MRHILALVILAVTLAVAGWPAASNAHLVAHELSSAHAQGQDGHHPDAPSVPEEDHYPGHCVSGACWSAAARVPTAPQLLSPPAARDLPVNPERPRGLSLERDPPVPRRG